jgi:hypothetical protein
MADPKTFHCNICKADFAKSNKSFHYQSKRHTEAEQKRLEDKTAYEISNFMEQYEYIKDRTASDIFGSISDIAKTLPDKALEEFEGEVKLLHIKLILKAISGRQKQK